MVVPLILLILTLAAAIYAFRAARALLEDGRERRAYRALADEDRAREITLQAEVADLEVQEAMSGLDDELSELLGRGQL